MKPLFLVTALLAISCRPEPGTPVVSKEPTSVRGWITDVERPESSTFKTVETEAARRGELYRSTNIWMDDAPYVSGGVAETGAFILLDVPPGKATIEFAPPGGPVSRLAMQGIPGNADVFLPGLILKKDGTVGLSDPRAVKVRLAARVPRETPNGAFATIAGQRIAVVNTPIAQMTDRHDYPTPPSAGPAPLATVK